MKALLLTTAILFATCTLLFAQVAINADGSVPNSSTILDIQSTSKGLLIPRMNVDQRDAIQDPAEGLLVFCTNCGSEGALSLYSGGTWKTFSPCIYTSPPSAGTHVLSPGQITWKWNAVTGAAGYRWNTINNYTSATDMGSALIKTETGILCNSSYQRYVWSYNTCATSAPTTLTYTTPALPAIPAEGSHASACFQITWNWNSVPGATGYKWNTVDNFATAIDMGTATTKTETTLTCNTLYQRYIWAYNTCGNSGSQTLSQSTLECPASFTCGATLSISHVAGSVSPVDKSTTYGTVSGIPGETGKCWITSNLGSDHQATAVDDATEASAGWYWQFNRKQGYKHDGTTRTPNTTWISSITENSDWTADNDPCSIELGSDWRIPSYSEWNNVKTTGNWTNWNGPWSSALKLHAAGAIVLTGNLWSRGAEARYYSSTQNSTTQAWALTFSSNSCSLSPNIKAYGFNVRCVMNCMEIPAPPSSGTHIPGYNFITWKWNVVSCAIGYKWNTSDDYVTATDVGSNTTYTETGLTSNSSYTRYVWAYNQYGVSTSSILTQTTKNCDNALIDQRDGKTYTAVLLGSQCWMAQNLNYQTGNSACYNYDATNCNTYGRLYDWNTATSACPSGWHLPSEAEYTTMINYVNSQPAYRCNGTSGWIAKALAASTLWNSSTDTCTPGNDLSQNNATGFSALAGGYFYQGAISQAKGLSGYWWTSTLESNGNYGRYFEIHYDWQEIFLGSAFIGSKESVRCLKD